jgi:hypothetical protein
MKNEISVVMRINKQVNPPTLVLEEQGNNGEKIAYTLNEGDELSWQARECIREADSQIVPNKAPHVKDALNRGQWVVFLGSVESL